MSETLSVRQEEVAGVEELVRSVRVLTRQTRELVESTASVAERELAMAISIAERLRDEVIDPKTLARARSEELPARVRDDAHRTVDLVADAAAVAFVVVKDFTESIVDDPRPSRVARSEEAKASAEANA